MTSEDHAWLVSVIVPNADWVIHACAEHVPVLLRESNMSHWVRVALVEANLLNLEISLIKSLLGDELILWSYQENTRISAHAAATISDVSALICLNCLMLNDVHVILQANDWGIAFKIGHDYVLIIVEEVATQEDSLAL